MRKINLLTHLYFPKDFFLFSILVLLLFSSSIVHATSNDCSNLFSKQFKENSPEKFLNWMDYESAKNYIQAQGVKTESQFRGWVKLGKRPKNFPSHPYTVYESKWKSWGDFLGNGNISNSKRNWMPYQEAKHYIQEQGIKTKREFEDWTLSGKRLKNFPSDPSRSYRAQWNSWREFLGTDNISNSKKSWMPYQEAKKYIQMQRLKTTGEFRRWTKSDKRPKDFPSNPHIIYKSEWKSWGDFLGTINLKDNQKNWMDYESAKNYIQAQGIKTTGEFRRWAKSDKRPKNFPSSPSRSYQTQWKSWGDFLGTINLKDNQKNWMDYESAKNYIQAQGVKTHREFGRWAKSDKRPKNFPSSPNRSYQTQWKSWGDFLGTINLKDNQKNWMDYESAKNYIQAQRIKTTGEFRRWAKSDKRPKNFPSSPSRSYKTQWRGWREFFGTGNISNSKRNWMPYTEAKMYIQSQGIKTKGEFRRWAKSDKRPKNFPSSPNRSYQTQWRGWRYFLGTQWANYQEVKIYVRALGLKNREEYRNLARNGENLSIKIPIAPDVTYKLEWEGWSEFLGNYRWMSYKKARAYARQMGIQSNKDFVNWLNSEERPKNFPLKPHKYYSEWKGLDNFLQIKWMPYRKAKSYVQSINIETKKEFFEWILSGKDQLEDFPSNPHKVYKEWEGWDEFLNSH